jgi:hypothetical protein
MTPYTKLKFHIERHKYTKGRNAGDAPADTSRRSKGHFRVVQRTSTRIDIVFHHTSILRVREDSPNIVLDSGGWHESPTTREALRDAVYLATGQRMWFGTHNENGYAQTTVVGKWVFYDGMEFDPMMNLVSPPQPFKAYRADREANKVLRELAKPYRGILPVLHTVGPTNGYDANARSTWYSLGRTEADRIEAALQQPEHWPLMTQLYWRETHKLTWQAIYAKLVEHNKVVVELK